jgi:hypothetical protein
MKPETGSLIRISAVALASAVLLATVPAAAQDKKAAAPAAEKKTDAKAAPEGTNKVILDNDKYRVWESTFKPGQGSKLQERGARITRALTDGTMERTYADGKTEKVEWKAGQVRYFPKEQFGNTNIGKKDMVFYIVQSK